MTYKLLAAFRRLFDGIQYRHRKSNLGDQVASYLYEDLVDLGRSPKLVQGVAAQARVINTRNVTVGKQARRGDGTFGERVPSIIAVTFPDHTVSFGEIATMEIGAEVKVLAKAMIKQIDRVCTDMINQVSEFKKHGGNPICVGIVGINCVNTYTSYEGDRVWTTDGKKHKHPIQEAAAAEQRLSNRVREYFDELIVLRFRAPNIQPYPFEWVDAADTETRYSASLVRISREYETRF